MYECVVVTSFKYITAIENFFKFFFIILNNLFLLLGNRIISEKWKPEAGAHCFLPVVGGGAALQLLVERTAAPLLYYQPCSCSPRGSDLCTFLWPVGRRLKRHAEVFDTECDGLPGRCSIACRARRPVDGFGVCPLSHS